jgi:hypothetical protein
VPLIEPLVEKHTFVVYIEPSYNGKGSVKQSAIQTCLLRCGRPLSRLRCTPALPHLSEYCIQRRRKLGTGQGQTHIVEGQARDLGSDHQADGLVSASQTIVEDVFERLIEEAIMYTVDPCLMPTWLLLEEIFGHGQ